MRQIIPFKISNTYLELQDFDTMQLDYITRIDIDSLFRIEKQEVMPYEKFDNTWISVTIERSLNMMHYERKVYTGLELLSDVGGFNGMLLLLFGVISNIWNFNNFDNFMVTRLFKIKKPKDELDADAEMPYFLKSDYIKIGNFPYFLELFRSLLPAKL